MQPVVWIATAGLIAALLAMRQHRVPAFLCHLIALCAAPILALAWTRQIPGVDGNATTGTIFHHWLTILAAPTQRLDPATVLFLLAMFEFILAYVAVWSVLKRRRPWPVLVVHTAVLFVGLEGTSFHADGVVLTVFMLAALLLILGCQAAQARVRWRELRLPSTVEPGRKMLWTGALISAAIIGCSWIAPSGYRSVAVAPVWTVLDRPVAKPANAQKPPSRQTRPAGLGAFKETLGLEGVPHLTDDVVATVRSTEGPTYLIALTYDIYTGGSWTNEPAQSIPRDAGEMVSAQAVRRQAIQQTIQLVNPPTEQDSYLLVPPGATDINVAADVRVRPTSGDPIGWVARDGALRPGMRYTVNAKPPVADGETLRTIPLPAAGTPAPTSIARPESATAYDPAILHASLQLPEHLDPRIAALARQITAQASTMYDKVVALETYLRTNYPYNPQAALPSGQEAVSWFLFQSDRGGYCTHFASAMTVMARSIGIPARVVAGYSPGEWEDRQQQSVVRGTNAHSWAQVYFADYGWVDFEPTASYPTFGHERAQQTTSAANRMPELLHVAEDTAAIVGSAMRVAQQWPLDRGGASILVGIVVVGLGGTSVIALRRRIGRDHRAEALGERIGRLGWWIGRARDRGETPVERLQRLALTVPDIAPSLKQLSDIYVRANWADPSSTEHPQRSGEMPEVPILLKQIQYGLLRHVLRRWVVVAGVRRP